MSLLAVRQVFSGTWRRHPRLVFMVLVLLIAFAILLVLRLAPKAALCEGIPYSLALQARNGELLRLTLAQDEQYRLWTPLAKMSPKLVAAVELYEDRWFRWHCGVNPVALLRGAWSTVTGSRRQGGSTLTMQLARRLYRIDSRSVGGKLHQVAAALWLEARYSKDEILEAYLNLAPYGGNIEGVGAAALVYFHKPVTQLSLPEALTLAVIPQNPRKRLANVALSGKIDGVLRQTVTRLWQRWRDKYPEDRRYDAAFSLPLQRRGLEALPFRAPHFTDALMRSAPVQGGVETTSLDLAMQNTLERLLTRFLEERRPLGVKNASALLLDTQTMQVRALVGSANFFDKAIDGQVNGMLAKRSPGSTLKPFIYGLALDQSLIHPKSILRDAPTAFGAFSPENFDGRFVGPITAEEALIRSRNVPAVALSAKLNRPGLYQLLQHAGVSRLASEQHYGLALALGGGEVTGEELAKLYAMLANGGRLRQISWREREGQENAPRLLSEEAAYITLDILRQNPRPDTYAPAVPPVAWKTGTSWGYRDAWTVGVLGKYVLVVWVGNFDGASNPAFVGIRVAAPLFFRIVDGLHAQGFVQRDKQVLRPAGVSEVEVCAASGELHHVHCPLRSKTLFIPGKSPIRASTLHRPVLIDKRTGKAVCTPGKDTEVVVFEFWSSEMRRLFREAGMPRREPPSLPDCGDGQAVMRQEVEAPRITSPLRGGTYAVRRAKPVPLALRADVATGAGALYWFADDAFIGVAKKGEAVAWLPERAGRYTVRVVDAAGRADARQVLVEFSE